MRALATIFGSYLACALSAAIVLGILAPSCAPSPSHVVRDRDGNPCDVSSVPVAYQQTALDDIADVVSGRLPGVKFFVVPYPARTPYGQLCVSYRAPGWNAYIVLSWKLDAGGRLLVQDIPWEVSHLVSGTDDQGRKWSP